MSANKKPIILIVDDEAAIRDLAKRNLEEEGYEVHTADGGKAALLLVTEPDMQIDILITDILMPFMNGRDLANRISSIKPGIKVLFISAYTAEILTQNNMCPEGAELIKKPFTKAYLLERIERVWAGGVSWKELVTRRV
jgi:two-component system, cell cycle sensor histidine kinase and response regulator CckA